jgi:hypothetical protein
MARGFHVADAGAAVTDRAAQAELDALFATVLYFDQHPTEFAGAVTKSDSTTRWRQVGSR